MHSRERIGELNVAFDDQGQGPAVVMLHPFPFDGRVWADNVQAVVSAGHRVITLDYPGFGDSPPPRSAVSIAQVAELVAGLMDRLAIDRAALLGLSMGGYTALAFARVFPARLNALILADTRAAADGPAALQGRADA
ncbi:MAG: alpha/beta fold hydrolase, partial [Deltaproteobacteria bacterium]|nr:alpha/beta fold hydrolase [Deltaproteobacteria bacterium]